MLRTTALSAALLGLALITPPGASAVGKTCHGKTATIVGQPDQTDLLGTEGPDVIVTNGAFIVDALGGDDLVCVTVDSYMTVRAGAGNDVVDATAGMAGTDGVFAVLGDGDDSYLGSAADEEVITGEDTETDSGTDVVETGSGADDMVYSGQFRVANPDRIEGDMLNIWWRGIPTATGFVDGGGDGDFRYYRPRGVTRIEIDARTGTLSTDVGTLAVSGFTSFAVDSNRDLSEVVFRGSGTGGRSGSGSSVELHGLPTAGAFFDGGGGSELVLDTTGASSVSIDTAADSYSRDDHSTTVTGFNDFVLTDDDGPRHVSFRGSERPETLTMTLTGNPSYDVDLGGGDDEIALETDRIHRRVTTFDGGSGLDQLGIVVPGKQVSLDLRRGRLLAGKPGRAVAAEARGFEDAEVIGSRIEMIGTRRDNDLRAHGCQVSVRALAGDDKISPLTLLYDQLLRCRTSRARFEGGSGSDVLIGDSGTDVLLGGPGRDLANGGSGRDTCRAERTRYCEMLR